MSAYENIEDLLLETMEAVSRYRVSQREATAAALDAGELLVEAKGRLPHGEWISWLSRVGLPRRTATTWMKLAKSGLTPEEVNERGGINAAAQGGKWASKPICPPPTSGMERELASVEATIADSKSAYYAALTKRQHLLRALSHPERGIS